MLRILTPNRALMALVFAPILYFVLALIFPAHTLREVFTSLSFGTYVVIAATWLFSFFAAIKHEGSSGKWRLILGIFVLAATVADTRIYSFFYNWYGRPESWANSPVPGFWSYSYLFAGVLILSAVTDEKERPIIALFPLMLAAALGGAAATIVFLLGVSAIG